MLLMKQCQGSLEEVRLQPPLKEAMVRFACATLEPASPFSFEGEHIHHHHQLFVKEATMKGKTHSISINNCLLVIKYNKFINILVLKVM